MDITTVLTTLLRDGFILVFNQDKLDIVKTAEALLAAGIGNMEVTCRIRSRWRSSRGCARNCPPSWPARPA